MASLLHRWGLAAARRPVAFVLAWVLLLAAAVGAMTTFAKPLSNEFEIPDSEFGRVLDQLGDEIPAVAGGSGTVVVHSQDGFDAQQKAALRDVMDEWESLPHVTDTIDPFATQARLDAGDERLAKARKRLVRNQEAYDTGAARLRGLEAYLENKTVWVNLD